MECSRTELCAGDTCVQLAASSTRKRPGCEGLIIDMAVGMVALAELQSRPYQPGLANDQTYAAMEEGRPGYHDEREAALSIAQRIAGFLNVKDLLAYLSLEDKVETCYKACGHVRDRAEKVLSSLSLLRLIEWGLGVITHVTQATAVAVVTSIDTVVATGKGICAQILRFIDYFVHLAHRVWKELRHMSLVDLIRALLILVTERLERDMTQMGSRESGNLSSKDPSSKGMTSLKGFLTSSIKDLEDFVGAGAEGGGDGPFGDGYYAVNGRIPQWNAGLGRPSTKMGLVVAYREKNETLSSLTKQKVRRMMHYQVPLRPFEATIRCQAPQAEEDPAGGDPTSEEEAILFPSVMCTPQSFPPTPISRACVMARFSHFSDDVVYLARDQLRLEELVKADDDVTKMAALSLKQQACLAVFNAEDTASGIVLSCGGHCATKVGSSTIYTSTRGMVPVLRNRYVFFQMSIMAEESAVASLCVGLSTPEMPLNTLVGSWKYSIGLCSTGQILLGSRWYGGSTNSFRFGCGCTVGVLVHIDERRSSESWDGELVEAFVRFSVNGVPVTLESEASASGGQGDVSTIFIPKDDDIYPTLTLQSLSTQVLGRFCAPDILHPHRQLIGAPPGVPVYALDGSVILRANDLVSSNVL